MKIAIAQIWQETHTFCPSLTGLAEFKQGGLFTGEEILDKMPGLGEIGGFIAAVDESTSGVELVPLVRAWAMSGGRVTAEALEYLENELISRLRENLPLAGLLISMHGASASEKVDDPEGYLLAKVRQVVGPRVPLVVSLDHHANLTYQMIQSVDALIGYQTQPHDPFETGQRAARILFSILEGKITPAIAWQKIPMLAPADRGRTNEWPMKAWFDMARAMERRPGVISVSNFPAQPWLDVPELGWSAVVITDSDPGLAKQLVAKLADKAWELRAEFWKVQRLPPAEAIRKAVEAKEGPIIICDASDSVLSGVPGDSTCLLQEMLKQHIRCTALLPMVDPEVVDSAISAGVGAEITVLIGGKLDPIFGKPLRVSGKVGGIAEEGLKFTLGKWGAADMGRSVLLEVGSIKLVVSEFRGIGGTHPDIYRHFGVEPSEARIIVVKTYFNYPDFAPMIKGAYMADCPGLSGWDLRQFEWKNAPRPLYPLDEMSGWQATGYLKEA
jgi:microcystin degradation protein MlrC